MLFDDELQEQLNRLASDGASARKFVAFIQKQELKRDIEGAEAFLRLTQAMIFHFNVGDSVRQFGQYFEDFIEQLALSTEVLAEKVLPQLKPFFANIPALSEGQHLNACLLAYHLYGVGRLFRRCEWKAVVEYLVGVVENSRAEHRQQLPSPVLWAVLALEQATRQGLEDGEQLSRCFDGMQSRQQQLSEYFHNFKEADIYSADFDRLQFQVGFLVANYLHVGSFYPCSPAEGFSGGCIPPPPHKSPPGGSSCIAICPPVPGRNFYELQEPPPVRVHYFPVVRNDDWKLPTVRSALSLFGGTFYYEAVLITIGKKVAIGWATREANFSEAKGVGGDQYGVAITGKGLLHKGKVAEKKSKSSCFKVGDVLGCLIDLKKRLFVFYLNGVQLASSASSSSEVNFSLQPYFAAASLGPHEQVWFNFGQVPFKHPPTDVGKYDTFDAVCGQDNNRYRLVAPTLLSRTDYCFKDTFVWDAPVEAMFLDEKQDRLDQLLIDLEVGVRSKTEFKQQLPSLLLESTDNVDQYAALRLFNSVLTEVGHRTVVLSGKSNEAEEALEKLFAVLSPQLTAVASSHPFPIAKIIELLLPYSQDRLGDQMMFAYQNVALILLAILSASPLPEKLSLLFSDELYFYLEEVLCRGHGGGQQNNLLLYKLITVQVIQRMALLNDWSNKRRLAKHNRIVNQLKHNSRLAKKSSASAQAKSSFDRLRVKLATASQAALDAIFSGDDEHQ
ncbi:RING finger and SPRY domain-containing protein 1 [Tyrophagus putrescentiae]|nr:RING finger and SPRY domain-containing protein 1 [Tyrophagus putrescentiae]